MIVSSYRLYYLCILTQNDKETNKKIFSLKKKSEKKKGFSLGHVSFQKGFFPISCSRDINMDASFMRSK